METVTVNLDDRSYPIYIGAGILPRVGPLLKERKLGSKVGVVTDVTVGRFYLEPILSSLSGSEFEPFAIEIPDGEQHKNLAWLAFVYDKMIDRRMDRQSVLMTLGGGVVGDLGGFAAATFLRGIPYVQMPTTLLAQVDASVGGKTGINHPAGKNLIGAFYQPQMVIIDVEVLRTLPRREFLAGLAEVIKYGIILDPDLFRLLEDELPAILRQNRDILSHVVKTCCTLKALVVEEDEREGDYRSILNFGHTVGHAIESLTEYQEFLHGEAIAVGMVFAARLSTHLGYCPPAVSERITRLLKKVGLPVDIPRELKGDHLALAMETDKKTAEGKVKFVCIDDIGRTRFAYLTAKEIVGYL